MFKTLQHSMSQSVSRAFDEPHEKLIAIVITILVYSVIYYMAYNNNKAFDKHGVHFEYTRNDMKTPLTFGHFLWFSCMINFGMPLGDIFPTTYFAKALCVSQASIVWIIMLSY